MEQKKLNDEQKQRLLDLQKQLSDMLKIQFQLDDVSIFADIINDGATAMFELEMIVQEKSAEIVKSVQQLASGLFVAERSLDLSDEQRNEARALVNKKSKIPDFLRRFTK